LARAGRAAAQDHGDQPAVNIELPEAGGLAGMSGLPEGISPEEYQQALEAMQAMGLGGGFQPTAAPDPNEAMVTFARGDQSLDIRLTRVESKTLVTITLNRPLP